MKSLELIQKSNLKLNLLNAKEMKDLKGGLVPDACPPPVADPPIDPGKQ